MFLLRAEEMSLADEGWGTRLWMWSKEWIRSKVRGLIVSLCHGIKFNKKEKIVSATISTFLGLPQGLPKTCRGSYWIVFGPHASVSWSTPLVQEGNGAGYPCCDDPITRSHPSSLEKREKNPDACLRRVLEDKGVEGPFYFQIAMPCGKRWTKKAEYYAQKNSMNQLCWCALYKNEAQESKHQISQWKRKRMLIVKCQVNVTYFFHHLPQRAIMRTEWANALAVRLWFCHGS